jgi:hypothetical protein
MDDGRLDTQNTSCLSVNFDRVTIGRMADTHPFGPPFECAIDFSAKLHWRLFAQKAQHLGAAKAANTVMQKLGIKLCEAGSILETQVSSKLALGRRPVLALSDGLAQLLGQGMSLD